MKSQSLDEMDLKILRELQNDSSLTNVELAARVNLSPSPCLSRVKALEKAGVIDRYVALLNPAAIGATVNAFVHVTLEKQNAAASERFSSAVTRMAEVMDVFLMASDCEFLLRLAVQDISALESAVSRIARMDDVLNVKPNIVLKTLQQSTAFPLLQMNLNGQRNPKFRGDRQLGVVDSTRIRDESSASRAAARFRVASM